MRLGSVLLLAFLAACDGLYVSDEEAQGYYDRDGDGYPVSAAAAFGATGPYDCDDAADTVHPGATELCNGADDDCDGPIDEDATDAPPWHADLDQDGHGAGAGLVQCEAPPNHVASDDDCDDSDGDVLPGATEICNGVDDDCDGDVDEDGDFVSWYPDEDGDGFGDPSGETLACSAPDTGWVTVADDCDDDAAAVNPDADEIWYDGTDQDCSGGSDHDQDGDGYDTLASGGLDCEDTIAEANPDGTEICNGVDDDCNGETDEAGDLVAWYPDADGDKHGDASGLVMSCTKPDSTYVLVGDDCDDADSTAYPSATETCDGVDDDCDSSIDEDVKTTFYADSDKDGFGNVAVSVDACAAPTGYVTDATDCDDTRAAVFPGATEVCNTLDDDCDTTIDEGVKATFHADTDGDGYGDATASLEACAAPSGYVADDTDCDDDAAAVHPDATDIPYDGTDQDCSGADLVDVDGDGYDGTAAGGDDCDDTRADVNIGATDTWYDGVDQDCDGASDYDKDADGYDSDAYSGTDCDDTKAAVNPGATEIWYDGTDQDCDGKSDYDKDGDGHDSDAHSGADCDDTKAAISPAATEVWYDGTDQDCDGESDYDADADGYDSDAHGGTDCDDTKASVNTGATEVWYDGVDQACDGGSDYDADGDGYDSDAFSGTDCDDTTTLASPALTEVCDDGLDNDCDGTSNSCRLTGTLLVSDADASIAIAPWTDITAGDMDGDGDDDIAVLSTDVYVFEAPFSGFTDATTAVFVNYPGGFTGVSMRGDHDGDGLADVAASKSGNVRIASGPITSTWTYTASAGNAGIGDSIASIGDLDGDGTDEVAIGNASTWVWVYSGPLSGTMTTSSQFTSSAGFGTRMAPAGDLDGDGWPDMLVTRPDSSGGGSSVLAYMGPLGATTPAYSATFTVGTDLALSDTSGDLNGDGRDDLAVAVGSTGATKVFYGTAPLGSGGTSTVITDSKGHPAGSGIAIGDFDGDGVDDLAVGSRSDGASYYGAVYVFYGPLSGAILDVSAADLMMSGASPGSLTGTVRAADTDGNGTPDLIVGSDDGVLVFTTSGL